MATEPILKQVENLCALLGGRSNLNVGNSRTSNFRQNEMPAYSIDYRFDESTEQNIGILLRKSVFGGPHSQHFCTVKNRKFIISFGSQDCSWTHEKKLKENEQGYLIRPFLCFTSACCCQSFPENMYIWEKCAPNIASCVFSISNRWMLEITDNLLEDWPP